MLKRVFIVIGVVWGLFLFVKAVDYHDRCAPHSGLTKYDYPIYCENLTLTKSIIEGLIALALILPIYYLFVWIIYGKKGLKKKSKK